ncbi:hypothetical protein [Pseudomonas sp. GV047]|uniref:hypothetical protein n=1 Tax=Pseudomonas sp. GV047 TaxID=2135751 RepID=UPI000D42954B|nr:hypothetical protein [Pseudomonas sp. GV047]PUB40143.1 hypothetical protein C8K58_114133 [Pseudomonas sp. GV047]
MKIRTSFMILGGLLALSGSGYLLADTLALSVPLPAPLPQLKVLTLLIGIHLLGMCFGLGGATMLDLWILRWMRRGSLPVEIGRTFHFISDAVTIGLCLLWLSGLGFLALYAMESPEKFENPKLWAKVIVVIVLTINGVIIHALVLPEALRDLSRPLLFGVSRKRAALFLASGAVSGVSWYTAFAFGIFRELNNSVTFTLLVIMWLTLIVAASLAAMLLWLNSAAGTRKPPSLSHPT